ncbi:MAG: hypothetical protein ACERLM_05350 [Acidimicrobiales bacterium]
MDAERRAALRLAKLRALAPVTEAQGETMAFGPVVREGPQAWTMVDDLTTLVGAVVWALRAAVPALNVVLEPSDTVDPVSIAASAALLAQPPITVWQASVDAVEEVAVPPPPPAIAPPVAPGETEPLMAVLREHGVDPVVEDGVVIGEIAGLEVAASTSVVTSRCCRSEWGSSIAISTTCWPRWRGPIPPSSSPRRPERSNSIAGREPRPIRCTGCGVSAGCDRRSWPIPPRWGAHD